MRVAKTDYQAGAWRIPRWILALTIALTLAACGNLGGEKVGQEPREDAVLATRVKAELLGIPELNAAAIDVDGEQGRVILTGFVGTREERQQAEEVARKVDGVEEIVNELEVKE